MFVHHFTHLGYLDPGAGSMILQMLVGGILGGALLIKLQWKRLVRFFTRNKSDVDADDSSRQKPHSD